VKRKDRCYKFETREKSYAAAKADCVNNQPAAATLVHIKSAEEQDFIAGM